MHRQRGRCACVLLLLFTAPAGLSESLDEPLVRITHERIDECSGIVWLDGAFFVHNDSGDRPVLYRCPTLDFAGAEVLELPGARAVDWEDIATLDGDLLIGDIGDNRFSRDDTALYRARYHPPATPDSAGRLELRAIYPFRYPDGPHNAEALTVIDGRVHIISKTGLGRGTQVYCFDRLLSVEELPAGEANVPRLVGGLDLGPGEMVTAADCDPERGLLALLTYTGVAFYPSRSLAGQPATVRALAAKQSEALCFHAGRLIVTNEQRDVYLLEIPN